MSPEKKRKRDKGAHEFTHVDADLVVAVPPVFAANPAQGVEEMLDSMLMRYIPPLRGVVLAHDSLRFLDPTAELRGDSPFAVARVAFGATVWSPRVGQRLTGRITLSSPDHVALLVHRTFNVAIPAAHVPRDQWEFVPGAADDADGDADAPVEDAVMGDADDADVTADAGVDAAATVDDVQHTPGHWMHTETHTHLGGPSRTLTFTVISLTIANQMLSLVGSLLPDPFALPANPTPAPEEEEALPLATSDADLDLDVFAALGRSTDAAVRAAEKEERKKKKKKRKAEGEEGKSEEKTERKEKKKRKREGEEEGRKKARREKVEET